MDLVEELRKLAFTLEVAACEKCRVCGGGMSIASADREGIKYRCVKAQKDWSEAHYPMSGSTYEHYDNSMQWGDEAKEGYSFSARRIRGILKESEEEQGKTAISDHSPRQG